MVPPDSSTMRNRVPRRELLPAPVRPMTCVLIQRATQSHSHAHQLHGIHAMAADGHKNPPQPTAQRHGTTIPPTTPTRTPTVWPPSARKVTPRSTGSSSGRYRISTSLKQMVPEDGQLDGTSVAGRAFSSAAMSCRTAVDGAGLLKCHANRKHTTRHTRVPVSGDARLHILAPPWPP